MQKQVKKSNVKSNKEFIYEWTIVFISVCSSKNFQATFKFKKTKKEVKLFVIAVSLCDSF